MRLPWRDRGDSDRLSEIEIPVQVDVGRRPEEERGRHQLRQIPRPARGVFPLRHDAGARGRFEESAEPDRARFQPGFGGSRGYDGVRASGSDQVYGPTGEVADETTGRGAYAQ